MIQIMDVQRNHVLMLVLWPNYQVDIIVKLMIINVLDGINYARTFQLLDARREDVLIKQVLVKIT